MKNLKNPLQNQVQVKAVSNMIMEGTLYHQNGDHRD